MASIPHAAARIDGVEEDATHNHCTRETLSGPFHSIRKPRQIYYAPTIFSSSFFNAPILQAAARNDGVEKDGEREQCRLRQRGGCLGRTRAGTRETL